jgi:hypothetical protein
VRVIAADWPTGGDYPARGHRYLDRIYVKDLSKEEMNQSKNGQELQRALADEDGDE